MSYRADKQVIDTHTHTDRYTDRGDDNTRRPKLASGKKTLWNKLLGYISYDFHPPLPSNESLYEQIVLYICDLIGV